VPQSGDRLAAAMEAAYAAQAVDLEAALADAADAYARADRADAAAEALRDALAQVQTARIVSARSAGFELFVVPFESFRCCLFISGIKRGR
jgi:hypothetical protein